MLGFGVGRWVRRRVFDGESGVEKWQVGDGVAVGRWVRRRRTFHVGERSININHSLEWMFGDFISLVLVFMCQEHIN